jgi:hypothetical protein
MEKAVGLISDKKEVRLKALEIKIKRLEILIRKFETKNSTLLWIRSGLFLGVAVLSLVVTISWSFFPGVIIFLAGMFPFGWLVRINHRFDLAIARHSGWLALARTQVARIRLDWTTIPATLNKSIYGYEHPFDKDLDITGSHSLHQLLNTAYTSEGSERLAGWLLQDIPDPRVIYRRQSLVKELSPKSLFRGKLWLVTGINSGDLKEAWNGQRLLEWLHKHPQEKSLSAYTLLLSCLSVLTLVLLGLFFLKLVPALWLASFALYVLLFNLKGRDTGELYYEAYSLRDGLDKLKTVLLFLEKYPYRAGSELASLCQPLLVGEKRPSTQLKRLFWVINGVALYRNGPLWLTLNALVPWRYYFSLLLGKLRGDLLRQLPEWLEVWYELEALCSLANFHYLNPDYNFPVIREAGETLLDATELGHPLINPLTKVSNNFSLHFNRTKLAIITGSNMAGKSSFLRAIGVSLCLVNAGAPVNAEKFETSLFRLYSCILPPYTFTTNPRKRE